MALPRNLHLIVEYDGTDLAGWQRQDGQPTVQGALEDAFREMTGEPVAVQGAGRTDAGVHARGQAANARTTAIIPTGGFLRGLNTLLPRAIAVLEVAEADAAFDARRDARGKVYRYSIWNHFVRSPLHERTAWHVRAPLDLAAMREAAEILVGEHDFAAFRAADCERRTTVRTLRRVDVSAQGALVAIEVEGTAFLKNMVRILAGTLVSVGHGQLAVETVRRALASGARTDAGVTAPAAGLCLERVLY